MWTPGQLSQNLIGSILKTEVDKMAGKMELLEICSFLMPNGNPNYLEIVKYPMIRDLLSEKDRIYIHKILFLLVKDFCNAMNVVRNMNEDQMIEAANMLIEECGNFRIEDYVMMFQMGKKGELIEIRDRIDLQMITSMLDKYWVKRNNAAESHWENENRMFEGMGDQTRTESKMTNGIIGISAALDNLKTFMQDKK